MTKLINVAPAARVIIAAMICGVVCTENAIRIEPVRELPQAGGNGRANLPGPPLGGRALQVEEPARSRECCAEAAAHRAAAQGAWARPAH